MTSMENVRQMQEGKIIIGPTKESRDREDTGKFCLAKKNGWVRQLEENMGLDANIHIWLIYRIYCIRLQSL